MQLELLEDRLTPTTSLNWGGYAIVAAPYSVQAVYGSWTVPAVRGSGSAYSATWIGVDGYSSQTVEQVGTAQELHNGVPTYYAWWEFYPSLPERIPGAVRPGDQMRASVVMDPELKVVYDQPSGGGRTSYDTHSVGFTVQLADLTRGWAFSHYVGRARDTIQMSSAEWIMEAPFLGNALGGSLARLANFGSQSFFDCRATIGPLRNPADHLGTSVTPATTSGINESYMAGLVSVQPVTMVNAGNKPIAVAGPVASSATGSAFNVTFGPVAVNKPVSKPPAKPVASPKPPPRSVWNAPHLFPATARISGLGWRVYEGLHFSLYYL